MSNISKKEIPCPKCGKNNEFTFYNSVNVTLAPELKEKVLNNEIFVYKCSECGEETKILYPLLYNDMDNNFMVQFGPPNVIDEFEYMTVGNKENEFNEIIEQITKNITRRGCTNLLYLREKIFILENGFDDRIFELIRFKYKQSLESELKQNNKKGKILGLFFSIGVEKETNNKLIFLEVYTNIKDKPDVYKLKNEFYEELKNVYGPRFDRYNNCLIDEEFIDKFLDDCKNAVLDDVEDNEREMICVYDKCNEFHLCMRDNSFKKDIKVGDIVIIETIDRHLQCKVSKIVRVNYNFCPKYCSKYEKVIDVLDGPAFEGSDLIEKECSLEEIKEAIKTYKEKQNVGNFLKLTDLLKRKNLTIAVNISFSEEDTEQFQNVEKGDVVTTRDEAAITSIKYPINDKNYMILFTDNESQMKFGPTSVITTTFEDGLYFANKLDDISGVVINPKSDELALDFEKLKSIRFN